MNLTDTPLREVSDMLKSKKISATELLNEYLEIALKGCCITFCNDSAFECANDLDGRTQLLRPRTPIEGLPFSVKDNISTAGVLTTCNSRSLKTNVPEQNAVVVDGLLGAGAVLTAKNCMREFSVGKIEDSAFELRNYLVLAGTNRNINIGAFSVGTDLGKGDYFCGLWTFKPNPLRKAIHQGIISGAPNIERITYSARKADDLRFLHPFICRSKEPPETVGFSPSLYKVLVYDALNMADYVTAFLDNSGFSVYSGKMPFCADAGFVYDCVLSAEFFASLGKNGVVPQSTRGNLFFREEAILRRSENYGFEVKRLILTGAHLLSVNNAQNTSNIINYANAEFLAEIAEYLDKYDFIVSPLTYGDELSKASAIAGLPELTVPFGDMLSFKVVTKPENEHLLLDMAACFEKCL